MSYPAWWSDSITVYNKHEDPQTNYIRWYRTILHKCFWNNQYQRLKVGDVEIETDSILCRVPVNDKFLEKHIWTTKTNDEKADYFTFAQGDIVIRGVVEDEIDEYASGKRSNDLINKYKWQGCMKIDKFNNNTGVGRGIPHYHIEGV